MSGLVTMVARAAEWATTTREEVTNQMHGERGGGGRESERERERRERESSNYMPSSPQ